MGATRASPHNVSLLRAVARPRVSAAETARLAGAVEDWHGVMAVAREHHVLSLLARRLGECGAELPAETATALSAEFKCNYVQSMANAAVLIDLVKAFERKAIPAMPFKGVLLSASVYGDLAARAAGDVDILVRQSDLEPATALLEKRGFELDRQPDGSAGGNAEYCEYRFVRPSDELVVELRWRLNLNPVRFKRKLGVDWARRGCRTVRLAGAEVPDMRPEILLPVLCMHGTTHVWSRLSWICDVAQLIAARPELDWEETIQQARQSGLWRSLVLGVLLAVYVAEVPVPDEVRSRFESETSMASLARHLEQNLFDAPGTLPPGRVPYSIRVLDKWDQARLLMSWAYWQPNERDVASFRLPRALHPLYVLLRPIRVLFNRSPRL